MGSDNHGETLGQHDVLLKWSLDYMSQQCSAGWVYRRLVIRQQRFGSLVDLSQAIDVHLL